MRIGLDFDNTLVAYGHAFRDLAVERGLAPESTPPDKAAVRAHVWEHHDDKVWQLLQVAVYGHHIDRGRLTDGAGDFLLLCRDRGAELCVVSHKTEFAAIDPGGINLRRAALGWMEARGFFLPVCAGGFGFSPGEIFFEDTRAAKAARINGLGCDVFVDDLPEVLCHPDLDSGVERILYRERPEGTDCCTLAGPWPAIADHLFPDRRP
ncbi:hypothetical protein GM415_04335 [Pseudodesulfovibrio cashew]|uniref:Haloacid dehalogenase-like hydrolase n=1 Tax=Pseudodesulfovibrio cashew TaxID=2678688 RepID=A0A6I6JE86_9BACT|nr:hypothetical protein [Pseudodesulfovibrio cashew]QGY39380.1 hypothetical protein GM415_04335 [Pseudodesulfovibrio cashew]